VSFFVLVPSSFATEARSSSSRSITVLATVTLLRYQPSHK
jgi:hypothetical protein